MEMLFQQEISTLAMKHLQPMLPLQLTHNLTVLMQHSIMKLLMLVLMLILEIHLNILMDIQTFMQLVEV